MCTVLLPPGGYLIAVNKYIISYHIISNFPSEPFRGLIVDTNRLSVYHMDCLQFVAHPNVQQLLASIWYEGLPGFRRKNMVLQALEIVRIGIGFPVFSAMYIVAPHSKFGQTLRKPFIKFICHSASYFTFLCEYRLYILLYSKGFDGLGM